MTIDDLELFWAVAERQSITEAARAVAVSQPTASRRIKALEEEMGAPLIDRTIFPITLTPFGFLFLDFADEMLKRYRHLRLQAGSNQSIIGTLTISTSSSPAARLVTRWMSDFLNANPGIHLRLAEMNSAAVEQSIQAGESGIGFMGQKPLSSSLASLTIGEDEIVLLVPRHGFLPNLHYPLPWDILITLPFVMRSAGSGTQQAISRALFERGWPLPKHVVLEVETGSALIDAVESGLGAGFVSRELLYRRDLVACEPVAIRGFSLTRPFYCIYDPERIAHDASTRAFLRYASMRLRQEIPS